MDADERRAKHREQKRAAHAADPSKNRDRARRWREANRDRVRAYKRADYAKNREKQRARDRARYLLIRDVRRAQEKARYAANREAMRAKQRAARAADPEKYRQGAYAYRRANPARYRLYGIRKTAKNKSLEFDLDVEWIAERLRAGVCEMSGLPFDLTPTKSGGLGSRSANAPSVDRIDPKGGYTKANCRMILWWLNRAMADLGEQYAIAVFAAVIVQRSAR